MYHKYWGLKHSPFGNRRSYYPSTTHEEALARLHFLVDEQCRIGLVLGASGTGKSTLLDVFSRAVRAQNCRVAQVDLLGVDEQELLWQIAAQWEMNPKQTDDAFRLRRLISDALAADRHAQITDVLLLDNADTSREEVRDQLTRLALADGPTGGHLTMILTANPDHAHLLQHRLLELAELRIDLLAWQQDESIGYLTAGLVAAGCEKSPFEHAALCKLHELAQGIPRQLGQLAHLSLLAGAGKELSQVDAATVVAVNDELRVAAA